MSIPTAASPPIPNPDPPTMPSFHRRPLPEPPAVAFSGQKGRQLFAEALVQGTMDCFFPLIEQFRTQDEPAFCGLGTLTMVLNALAIDPQRTWKGVWRWFSERLLDCCAPLSEIEKTGIVFKQLVCLARCNGASVRAVGGNQCSEEEFRTDVIACCTPNAQTGFMVVGYSRKEFLQTGDGHYSPIGGYHRDTDSVLILDVARFKYPPHWVPLHLMWLSMQRLDPDTGKARGYMILRRQEEHTSVLFCITQKDTSPSLLSALPDRVRAAVQRTLEATANEDDVALVRSLISNLPNGTSSLLSTYSHTHGIQPQDGPTEHQQAAATLLAAVLTLPLSTHIKFLVEGGFLPTPPVPSPAEDLSPNDWSSVFWTVLLLSIPPAWLTPIPQLNDTTNQTTRNQKKKSSRLRDLGIGGLNTDINPLSKEICHLQLQLENVVAMETKTAGRDGEGRTEEGKLVALTSAASDRSCCGGGVACS